MDIPGYLPIYVLTGTAAAVAAILYGLNRALAADGWAARERKRATATAAAVLISWLGLVILLGGLGLYHAGSGDMPTIQYGILAPILIGAVLLWTSPSLHRLIDAVPQSWLVGVQLYRALGAIFLILYASGRLPALFAWPAGLGDIAIGLLAPIAGLAYARGVPGAAGYVAWWNVFGILDLAVAVGTGFATSPSLLQPQATTVEPASGLMTMLPMVLIPTFLVPLSILLHIASLLKLRREANRPEQRECGTAPSPAANQC